MTSYEINHFRKDKVKEVNGFKSNLFFKVVNCSKISNSWSDDLSVRYGPYRGVTSLSSYWRQETFFDIHRDWRWIILDYRVVIQVMELWGFLGLPLDGTGYCLFPVWLTASGWSLYLAVVCLAEAIIALVIIRRVEPRLMAKITGAMRPDRRWVRPHSPAPKSPLPPLNVISPIITYVCIF